MLKKNKREAESEKIDSQITIQKRGNSMSVHIEGSPSELANLLANVYDHNDGFFHTAQMSIEGWKVIKGCKESHLDEHVEELIDKFEELKNLTRKLH